MILNLRSEIFPRVVTGLMNIGEQPEECLRFNDFGATEFSVAKRFKKFILRGFGTYK